MRKAVCVKQVSCNGVPTARANPRVVRHLAEHHADIVHELTQVVAERALASA